uniref:HDC03386 n=1 Tax=Drosophila melanogaster TaxID=7227 RepID=Q6IH44_DROME|nr:TPA_inf: HDC03386 [Drosophila melanogaster]
MLRKENSNLKRILVSGECPPVTLDGDTITTTSTPNYLGLTLDRRLTWGPHINRKRIQANIRLKQLHWLIGKKSKRPSLPRNSAIHEELGIPWVDDEIYRHSVRYASRLENHPNHLAINILDNSQSLRRLQKTHPLDLTQH